MSLGTLYTIPEQAQGKRVRDSRSITPKKCAHELYTMTDPPDPRSRRVRWAQARPPRALRPLRGQQEARVLVQVPPRQDPCFRWRRWLPCFRDLCHRSLQ